MTDDGDTESSPDSWLHRVALKNYRSIAACDVALGSLTFLVGPNGAGKSNFVDALRFVSDSLTTTLDHAIRDRGGINEVRRRSGGHPNHFGVRLEMNLKFGGRATYSFQIAAKRGGGWEVQREECILDNDQFSVEQGRVRSGPVFPASPDRLYLVTASSFPVFREVFDALTSMGFYNLNPDALREPQAPDAGQLLHRDGRNLASVLGRLASESPDTKHRIEEYLAAIVPGISGFDRRVSGRQESIEFRQRVVGAAQPWRFPALNMSDGTLRAAGTLVGLFQRGITLVAIEEPETALHPAAAGVLYDVLVEASRSRQVLVTSHSPDLLDNPAIDAGDLLAVQSDDGATKIGTISQADRKVLSEQLYTPGELLRLGFLTPDETTVSNAQLDLFSA